MSEPLQIIDANDGDEDSALAGVLQYMQDSKAKSKRWVGKRKKKEEQKKEEEPKTILEGYRQMLSVSFRHHSSTSVGIWSFRCPQRVTVEQPLHTVARTFGKSIGGIFYMEPLEWLQTYLNGALTLNDGTHSLTLPEAWVAAIGSGGLDLDGFRVCGNLRRLGYVATPSRDSQANKGFDKQQQQQQQQEIAYSAKEALGQLADRGPKPMEKQRRNNARILYDIFKPENKSYKKTSPGLPDYRMAVVKTCNRFPSSHEMARWTQDPAIPVLLGLSEPGNAAFLQLQAFETPDISV